MTTKTGVKPGTIVLARIQFVDTFEIKERPALVLYTEGENVVVAGITSNLQAKGILLPKNIGLKIDSVLKLNYIFTISEKMIVKPLCTLPLMKKQIVFKELTTKLQQLTT
jgi:mRNA interferase MazF